MNYFLIFFTILIFVCPDFILGSSKYSECENLEPNKIKILEERKEMKVWFGSEVSVTCCMKDYQISSRPNNDFDDELDLSNSKHSEPLIWYDPNMKPIVNYFSDNALAQKNGVYMIPEMLQQSKDLQIIHLVIRNFTTTDNGLYKCDTIRSNQHAETINIIGNPKIIIDAEEYQFLEEGQTGYITCRPRGHPKIEIVWFYKGEHLSPDNHKYSFLQNHQTLRISFVTEGFAGKYLCKAEVVSSDPMDSSTKASFIEIQPIEVIVYEKPKLREESPTVKSQFSTPDDKDVAAVEDGILDIACDSTGLPPPTITWYRDNVQINHTVDSRVNITEAYYRRNAYSNLRIQPVQIQDIGTYTCNSSFSFRGFSISVAKNVTPEFVFQPRFLTLGTKLDANSLVGKDVILNCSVFGALSKRLTVSFVHEGFNNNSHIYDISSETETVKYLQKQDPDNQYISHYQLTILAIQPSDAGWYYCQSFIKYDQVYSVSNVGVVSVLYQPRIIPSKSVIHGLWYKKNILRCKAKGYPTPVWEWKFQEYQLSNQFEQYQIKIINKNDTSISELTILPNYNNDAIFGTYQCLAENQFGSDSNSISFAQAWQPGPPIVKVCKVTASTIKLCVTPNPDSGGLPLTHYEMRIKDFGVNKLFGPYYYPVNPSTITLSHLKSNMPYKIALSAASEAGRGANTEVEVKTNQFSQPIVEIVNKSSSPDFNSFNLKWVVDNDGGLPIIQFNVQVQQVKVDPKDTNNVIERIGDVKSYVIDDLSQFKQMFHVNSLIPNTWYELKFSAANLIGPSIPKTVVFRTLDYSSLAKSQQLRFNYNSANSLNPICVLFITWTLFLGYSVSLVI